MRFYTAGTGTSECSAPFDVKSHFIGVASEKNTGRNGIEDTKDANTNHKFLKFLGFRTALLFENSTNAGQTGQSGKKETSAEEQMKTEWKKNEPSE